MYKVTPLSTHDGWTHNNLHCEGYLHTSKVYAEKKHFLFSPQRDLYELLVFIVNSMKSNFT
jgi:hypothetical protein